MNLFWRTWGKMAHWATVWLGKAKHPYFKTNSGIFIDLNHFEAARWHTQQIKHHILHARRNDCSNIFTLQQELHLGIEYHATYQIRFVSSRGKWRNLAFAIFADFTCGIEKAQGVFAAPLCYMKHSSFAAEDLPSSYLGFFSELTNTPFPIIMAILGGGWYSKQMPDPNFRSRNFRFLPLDARKNYSEHGAWPSPLMLALNELEDTTYLWRRIDAGIHLNLPIGRIPIWSDTNE